MANRLVSVDENFQLPPEVRDQLSQDVEADLQGLVDTATTAATVASDASASATADAATASGASSSAEESAASAAETADEITNLLDAWVVDTSDAGVNTLVENPASLTRQSLDDLYAFDASDIEDSLANVPTFEEQSISMPLAFGDITASTYIPIYTALFNCRIQQAALTAAASVVTDSTNYWNIRFLRYRDGWATLMGEKRTIPVSEGGEGIAAYNRWEYDLVGFTDTALMKGDVVVIHMSRNGTVTPLTRPTVTFRVNAADDVELPPSTQVAYDIFQRANASSLGTSTGGQVWETSTGWSISGKAAMSSTTVSGRAMMDTGLSDCTIEQRISAMGASGSAGINFRYTDDNNGWGVVPHTFFKNVNGVVTYIDINWGASVGNIVAGDTVRVILNGSKIRILIDRGSTGTFEQAADYNDTFNQTGTRHGMRSSGSTAHKVDLWQVTA